VDNAEQDALIAKISSEFARVVTFAKAERAVRDPEDEHAQWLDRLIAGLEPLAQQAHDWETLVAVRRLIERHGPGPWPIENLASMTDQDLASVRRVLASLTQAGLAAPPPTQPDDPA
jgi:predicted Rossmann fold nucleotide-binding protein DprA/Smf involved in DNA uptake